MPHTVTIVTPDPPAQLDLAIAEGATFNVEFTWLNNGVAQSLAGYAAKLSVSRRVSVAPIFTVTSQANEIVLEPSSRTGVVSVSVPALKTALLGAFRGRAGRYDLLVIAPDGSIIRLAEGAVTVDAAVTPVGALTSPPPVEVSSILTVYGTPEEGSVPAWNPTLQRLEFAAPGGFGATGVSGRRLSALSTAPSVSVPAGWGGNYYMSFDTAFTVTQGEDYWGFAGSALPLGMIVDPDTPSNFVYPPEAVDHCFAVNYGLELVSDNVADADKSVPYSVFGVDGVARGTPKLADFAIAGSFIDRVYVGTTNGNLGMSFATGALVGNLTLTGYVVVAELF